MRKKLLHIIFLCASCLVVLSCSNLQDEPAVDSSIKVSLGITTRSNVAQEGMEIGTGLPQTLKLWIFGVNGSDETLLQFISQDATNDHIFQDGTDLYGNPVHVIEKVLEKGKEYAQLKFFVVLNDEAVSWTDNTPLDGNIASSAALKSLTFSLSGNLSNTNNEDNEQLMYGEYTLAVNESITNYDDIEIETTRAVAKLELHFAKGLEGNSLSINRVGLKNTPSCGKLWEEHTIDGLSYSSDEVYLLQTPSEIDKTHSVEQTIGDFHLYESNFQMLELTNPFLLENENGGSWKKNDKDSDEVYDESEAENANAYQLCINYTINGEEKTKEFLLPEIERNALYKVYVRIVDFACELALLHYVVDWEEGGNHYLTFE